MKFDNKFGNQCINHQLRLVKHNFKISSILIVNQKTLIVNQKTLIVNQKTLIVNQKTLKMAKKSLDSIMTLKSPRNMKHGNCPV